MIAALTWIVVYPDRPQFFAAVLILTKLVADSLLLLLERTRWCAA